MHFTDRDAWLIRSICETCQINLKPNAVNLVFG